MLSLAALVLLEACSTTRSLSDGQYLLRQNTIVSEDPSYNTAVLSTYLAQKPNSYLFGINPFLSVYGWEGNVWKKVGDAPVVYDPYKVEESIGNIEEHLRYTGYYGSKVESRVEVKGRKVYVTYYISPGKRFTISSIDYDIPSYGTFREDFERDRENIGLERGQFLSEEALDAESDRSARYFRTIGYYGFSKSYYTFEADTLSSDGNARLRVTIRDYARGETPSAARQHKKYTLGEISIFKPKGLRIRKGVLEDLNILRPGQVYDETLINTTYSRFASVNMLSGVNIKLEPREGDRLDCNISLRNSSIQGFKTNLEASVNSTGLFGISPQLSYFHKNVFHGGEILNIGLKGNFQFKPDDDAYSTEYSITSSLRFPRALGLPNSLFTGPYIPRTDLALSLSYQDRPEYRRRMISSSISYTGRWGRRISYQLSPVQVSSVKLFDADADFLKGLSATNPYILAAYMDHLDLGVGGSILYTTDSSTIPTVPYHYYRFGLDLSGNVVSLFDSLMPVNDNGQHTIAGIPYAQYVRGEFQYGKVFRFGKADRQALALHCTLGAGYAYGNAYSLPIEKQFYAGGATSMRGWQARTLGPGTSAMLTEFAIPSQIGEMKLEVNAEYRFPIVSIVEGALFVDVGNIWDIRTGQAQGSVFHFDDFYKALGADWGLGLRLNLDFLLVRFDAGVKLHDPSLAEGSRWISPLNMFQGSNTSIHFGVGYPF